MALRIRGIDGLALRLENFAEKSSEGARFAMERGAKKIQKLAKDYAPIDEGNLEDSIKVQSKSEGIRRRKVFDVFIDESSEGTRASTVEQYAYVMHEGHYELGEKSKLKDVAVGPGKVGPKYLSRAAEDLSDEIKADVLANVSKRIGK